MPSTASGRRSATQLFEPPNPNEFDIVTRTRRCAGLSRTNARSHSGSGSRRLALTGSSPWWIASAHTATSTAPPRRLPFLEDQEPRAFAQKEAVARGIEWAARSLRRVVVRRQRREQTEAGDPDGADHRVESTGQRTIDRATADQLERGADCLS